MRLLRCFLCLYSMCFATYAFSEETAEVAVTEEVVEEVAPAMEEKAEVVIESSEEKMEEAAVEAAEPS